MARRKAHDGNSTDGDSAPRPFSVLESDDIELVSVATGRRVTLDTAMREGWVVCHHCGAPYDPTDVQLLREDGGEHAACISDACRRRSAPLQTDPLPLERIVVFAASNMEREFREGLLYQLFYAGDSDRIHPHFTLREQGTADAAARPAPVVPQAEARIQEENWSGMGLVITKRRRGKFVAWVPLGS
ncbi:MAG: hypothetical protein AB7K09_16530 [Planctomycetota bacterium]